jgi:hypothetical protein
MVGLVAAAALVIAPRTARACGQGGNYGGLVTAIFVGAIVIGGADLSLTAWDLTSAARSHQPSVGYGVLETLVAGPQFAIGLAALTSGSGSGALALYTAWMGLLTTHGVWTIAKAAARPDPALEDAPPPPSQDPAPLLQVGIGPTYVPVGQLAQPGIGLVGRF